MKRNVVISKVYLDYLEIEKTRKNFFVLMKFCCCSAKGREKWREQYTRRQFFTVLYSVKYTKKSYSMWSIY